MESLGFSISDFYAEVAEIQVDENTDAHMKLFIDCLLASMDYESFYKVMVKEGRKVKPGMCDPKNGGLDASAGEKGSSRSPARACKEYVAPESKMGGGGGGDGDMGDAKEAKGSRGAGSK